MAGRSPNRSNASGSISLYIYRDYEKSQHTAIKTSDTSCVCLVFRIFNNVVVSRLLTRRQWEHIHKLANVIGGRYSGLVAVGELSSTEKQLIPYRTSGQALVPQPIRSSPFVVVSRHPHHSNAGGLTQYVHLWERTAVNMRQRGPAPRGDCPFLLYPDSPSPLSHGSAFRVSSLIDD